METNTDSVCTWLESMRKSHRKFMLCKCITIKLFKENNRQLSTRLAVTYNTSTENINFTHSLYYLGKQYCPDVSFNKRACTNEHTVKQYKKSLKYMREKVRAKMISFKLFNDMRSSTHIMYNINTNNVYIINMIFYKSKQIKTGIR